MLLFHGVGMPDFRNLFDTVEPLTRALPRVTQDNQCFTRVLPRAPQPV